VAVFSPASRMPFLLTSMNILRADRSDSPESKTPSLSASLKILPEIEAVWR